ncbi:uncharacterized protein LOC128224223 isoform X2 [Mya arenaria]|uniref:uncharacterized protein LOC128224223 isoform X2 n=1 Tax=Mya arenaria TaxID=6604 RepID=UPI0022E2C137|nr:uncharacterized protein LOC128224223 isoform X2 [Mya arenaria]
MSGWNSLSGYLHYKSGTAFGRLILRRKVWSVLDEAQCHLVLYKHEDDVHKQRSPYLVITLQGSAISLDLEHQNQFIILSEKKEHVFTAENHESMMIWLLGVQSKREKYVRQLTTTNSQASDSNQEDSRMWNCKPSLYSSMCRSPNTSARETQSAKSSPVLQRQTKFSWDKSGDSGFDPGLKKRLESSKSFPLNRGYPRQNFARAKLASTQNATSFESDCDDVFSREMLEIHHQEPPISKNWRKIQLVVMGHVVGGHDTYVPGHLANERRSYSSRSASSDSAIERGEGTPQELSARLQELEKELISTKCELAKVLNRQTCFQELLYHREDTIKHLEQQQQNGDAGTKHDDQTRCNKKGGKFDQDFQERVRVLQNQNRFLNEEVRKLSRLRSQDQGMYQEQVLKQQSLEADIDQWKMDYVSLIQSSIRHPDETAEDVQLCLYGGDKHKKRVQSLLEEARKINPRLPTYDSLANNEVHVDGYGFKHVYTNTGLLLHYLCTELTHHYLIQAGVYEEHQKRWTIFMRQHGKDPVKSLPELKTLCRAGIPDRFRKQVWRQLVRYRVRDLIREKGDYYYRNLCNLLPESPLAACYRKQVSLDLMRTMPSNVKFTTVGSKGIMDLQDILLAFCIHNPTIGYCQGMNFIAGMALIFMEPEDAFWTLVAIAESYFSPHYFDHSLIGAQADQQILKEMVQEKLPALSAHLEAIDIELSTVTLNWFLAVFFDAVPFQTLLRMWDCFLLEGPKVLFRFSLAILQLHENDILQKCDTMGVMKHLKACTKLTYDVDGLMQLSFEGMRPFPKRRDIQSRQTCYLNALKEKYKRKELQRLAFAEREQMYMSMEAESGSFLGIECAVTLDNGRVWFCYGDQNMGRLCCVSCDSSTMFTVDFKLETRVMCMCALGTNELLLGTISWQLVAIETQNHTSTWQVQLHDAILSLCCYDDSEANMTRIFAGLADGTVAVNEKQYNQSEPNLDVIYVTIGQAPVTCLMLLGDQVWCASGNTVAIMHAKTLDAMDIFSVSVNPYDHILSLCVSPFGIWISLRGSSILELWDPKTLNCRMLYDTRTDRYPQLRKEDDTYFNRARITSLLAYGDSVWVGTGEGNLVVYGVMESLQLATPTDLSPSIETTSSMSYIVRPSKHREYQSEPRLTGREQKHPESSNQSSLGLQQDSDEIEYEDNAEDKFCTNGDGLNKQAVSKPKLSLRRRSSSENDIDFLMAHRYLNDISSNMEKLLEGQGQGQTSQGHVEVEGQFQSLCVPGKIERNCSENDLELLEKIRNYSVDDEDVAQAVEEDEEIEMERIARKNSATMLNEDESFTSMKNQISSQKLSVESRFDIDSGSGRSRVDRRKNTEKRGVFEQRRSAQNVSQERGSTGGSLWSEDSGCELTSKKARGLESKNSEGSGSVKRSLFTQTVVSSVDMEEDVFEARMEEKARRESFASMVMDQVSENPDVQVERSSDSEKVRFIDKQESLLNKNGTVISIYLEDRSDHSNEAHVYANNQLSIVNGGGARGISFDEDYLSSGASVSVSPAVTPESKKTVRKRLSQLGRSIDSDEGRDKNDILTSGLQNGVDDNVDEDDDDDDDDIVDDDDEDLRVFNFTKGRRRSSAIEDMSQLCSECKKLKSRCKDCTLLLQSQETMKVFETRRISLSCSPCEELDNKALENKSRRLNGVQKFDGDFIVHRSIEVDDDEVNVETSQPLTNKCNNDDSHSAISGECNLVINKVPYGNQDDTCKEIVDDSEKFTVDKGNDVEDEKGEIRRGSLSDSELSRTREGYEMEEHHGTQVKMFPSEIQSCGDISRQEKVGYWLSSISHGSTGFHDNSMPSNCGYHGNSGINSKRTVNHERDLHDIGQSMQDRRNSGLVGQENDGCHGNSCESDHKSRSYAKDRRPSGQSDKGNNENFLKAENKKIGSGKTSPDRPHTLNLIGKLKSFYGDQKSKKLDDTQGSKVKRHGSTSADSGSSTQKSAKVVHVNRGDQDAQYRLDFSNVVVDTEIDCGHITPNGERRSSHNSHSDLDLQSDFDRHRTAMLERDSRKNSLDLGCIQEKCSRLESDVSMATSSHGSLNSLSGSLGSLDSLNSSPSSKGATSGEGRGSERKKLFEFLKTPSLASRQASLGLKIIEDDIEWTELYSGNYTSQSPSSSTEKRIADFLRTPSISSKPSSLWSSYENISTPSQVCPTPTPPVDTRPHTRDKRWLHPGTPSYGRGRLSHSPSNASIGSEGDLLYNVDLNMEAKMKISDKPIKYLLATSCKNEPLIISFSGSFGDDEAVLKWRKHENEQLWTNEPILEVCPHTKMTILPTYMRRRMSSNSSYKSFSSCHSDLSHRK